MENIFNQERIHIDFSTVDKSFQFTLGRVNYIKAHQPLEEHVHVGMTEFVLIVKGRQIYHVDNKDYTVESSELFVTHADESHSTGSAPEDKSLLYFLLVNMEHCAKYLCFDKSEAEAIKQALTSIKSRKFESNAQTKAYFDALIMSFFEESAIKKTVIKNRLTTLLIDILGCEKEKNTAAKAAVTDEMQRVLAYIAKNISEDISVQTLADIASLSLSRFKQNFREQLGIPPREYVLRQKIEVAKELLLSGESNITAISHSLAFSSSQYFSTVFKRFTFQTPYEYKMSMPVS